MPFAGYVKSLKILSSKATFTQTRVQIWVSVYDSYKLLFYKSKDMSA